MLPIDFDFDANLIFSNKDLKKYNEEVKRQSSVCEQQTHPEEQEEPLNQSRNKKKKGLMRNIFKSVKNVLSKYKRDKK